jgi:flavin-binding protein dodecin
LFDPLDSLVFLIFLENLFYSKRKTNITTTVLSFRFISTSDKSWQDALEKKLERASKTIRNIKGVDVTSWKAQVDNGQIVEYRAVMKIAFEVKE